MFFCEICSVKLSGPKDHDAHIAGKRHQAKIRSSRPVQANEASASRRPTATRGRPHRPPTAVPARPGPTTSNQQIRGPTSIDSARPSRIASSRATRGGRWYQPSRLPTGRATSPPSDSDNHRSKEPPRKPLGPQGPDVDFGVVRNTDSETKWGTYDLLPDAGVEMAEPICRIFPVKRSRKKSVKGFISDNNPVAISAGYRLRFGFNTQAIKAGVHIVRARVRFTLNGNKASRTLKLKGIVGEPEDHAALKPVKPYQPMQREDIQDDWQRGRMLRNKPRQATLDFGRLPFYDIPPLYWMEAQRHAGNDPMIEISLNYRLPNEFNISTYKNWWTHLLRYEEIAICNKLKQFDMKNAPIFHLPDAPGKHTLAVPGLEEKRPSVIVTDLVAIRKPHIERLVYGGYVTGVRKSEVVLQLHEDFPG